MKNNFLFYYFALFVFFIASLLYFISFNRIRDNIKRVREAESGSSFVLDIGSVRDSKESKF